MTDPNFFEAFRERVQQQLMPVEAPTRGGLVPKMDNEFGRAFAVSFLGHAFILIVFAVGPMLSSFLGLSDYSERFQKKEFRNAIRVDLVGLPKLTVQELQNIDPTLEVGKPAKKEEAPPVEEAAPTPSETAMKLPEKSDTAALDAKKKKEAEAAQKKAADASRKRLEELRASLRVEQRRKELLDEIKGNDKGVGTGDGGRPALSGNILSQGYSVTGDVATDMDVFQGHLKAHLRKSWNLPGWMEASNLSARVVVKLAPNGRILSQSFLKQSGNEEFDRYVSQAIKNAEPYPQPPPSLQRIVMEEGIEWGFPQ